MNDFYLAKMQINPYHMGVWIASRNHSDPDRAAHCLVSESFDDPKALRPFVIKGGTGKLWNVYAYTNHDGDELRAIAEERQSSLLAQILPASSIKTALVHVAKWPETAKLSIEVRVCPTYRKDGVERDAQYKPEYDGMDQDEAYCRWLQDIYARQGGVRVVPNTTVISQTRRRDVIRHPGRNPMNTPDVTIHCTVEVVNSDLATELFRNGIGRHRAFGYGMVLVRGRG